MDGWVAQFSEIGLPWSEARVYTNYFGKLSPPGKPRGGKECVNIHNRLAPHLSFLARAIHMAAREEAGPPSPLGEVLRCMSIWSERCLGARLRRCRLTSSPKESWKKSGRRTACAVLLCQPLQMWSWPLWARPTAAHSHPRTLRALRVVVTSLRPSPARRGPSRGQ